MFGYFNPEYFDPAYFDTPVFVSTREPVIARAIPTIKANAIDPVMARTIPVIKSDKG